MWGGGMRRQHRQGSEFVRVQSPRAASILQGSPACLPIHKKRPTAVSMCCCALPRHMHTPRQAARCDMPQHSCQAGSLLVLGGSIGAPAGAARLLPLPHQTHTLTCPCVEIPTTTTPRPPTPHRDGPKAHMPPPPPPPPTPTPTKSITCPYPPRPPKSNTCPPPPPTHSSKR